MSQAKWRSGEKARRWEETIGLWKESGLSIREFCRQMEVSEPSFHNWKRKLAQAETSAEEGATFVPIELTAEPSVIEIVLAGDRVIRVCGQVCPATLREVLAAVEAQGC